jgi:hypothetical protein
MWARTVEVMLGCWLAISPFVFHHAADEAALWWNDLGTAAVVIAFALGSLYRPLRHAHLLTLLVAAWLVGFGYVTSLSAASPASQNQIAVGLLLLIFAIVPTESNKPPESWREYSRDPASRR